MCVCAHVCITVRLSLQLESEMISVRELAERNAFNAPIDNEVAAAASGAPSVRTPGLHVLREMDQATREQRLTLWAVDVLKYICVYVCIYSTCMYIYLYVYLYNYMYIRIYSMSTHALGSGCAQVYTCMYVCLYYIYIYIYVNMIYVYICI